MTTYSEIDIHNREHDETASARKVILVDSSGNALKVSSLFYPFSGSSGVGGDEYQQGRTFTLPVSSSLEIDTVYRDGVLLTPITHWSKDDSAKTVTISLPVYDDQTIVVGYRI